MPNFQAEYEQALLRHFIDENGPTPFLKSLILQAMLMQNKISDWKMQTVTASALPKRMRSHLPTSIHPDTPLKWLCQRDGSAFDFAATGFFRENYSHEDLLAQINKFFLAQKNQFSSHVLSLVCAATHLTPFVGMIREDFITESGYLLVDHGYFQDLAELERHVDFVRAVTYQAAGTLASTWQAIMEDYLKNPGVSNPERQPFVLRSYVTVTDILGYFIQCSTCFVPVRKMLLLLPWIDPQYFKILIEHHSICYKIFAPEYKFSQVALSAAYWYYHLKDREEPELLHLLEREGARRDYIPDAMPDYAPAQQKSLYSDFQAGNTEAVIKFCTSASASTKKTVFFGRIEGGRETVLSKILMQYFSEVVSSTRAQGRTLLPIIANQLIAFNQLNQINSRFQIEQDVYLSHKLSICGFATAVIDDEFAFRKDLEVLSEEPWRLPLDSASAQQKNKLLEILKKIMQPVPASEQLTTPTLITHDAILQILESAECLDAAESLAATESSDILPFILTHNPWIAQRLRTNFRSMTMHKIPSPQQLEYSLHLLKFILMMTKITGIHYISEVFGDTPKYFFELQLLESCEPTLREEALVVLQTVNAHFRADPHSATLATLISAEIAYFLHLSAENINRVLTPDEIKKLQLLPNRFSADWNSRPTGHHVSVLLALAQRWDQKHLPTAVPTTSLLSNIFSTHANLLMIFANELSNMNTPHGPVIMRVFKCCPSAYLPQQLLRGPALLRNLAKVPNSHMAKNATAIALVLEILNFVVGCFEALGASAKKSWQMMFDHQFLTLSHFSYLREVNKVPLLQLMTLASLAEEDEVLWAQLKDFFQILQRTGHLEKILCEGQLLHLLIENDNSFSRQPDKLLKLGRIFFELDPTLFSNFIQDKKNALEAVVITCIRSTRFDLGKPALLRNLLQICLWTQKPFQSDSAEPNSAENYLLYRVIKSCMQLGSTHEDRQTNSVGLGFWTVEQILQIMVTEPRLKDNTDNFHAGLQIRALLLECLFRAVGDDITDMIFSAVDQHGLFGELYLDSDAVEGMPAAEKPQLALHTALQRKNFYAFSLLCTGFSKEKKLAETYRSFGVVSFMTTPSGVFWRWTEQKWSRSGQRIFNHKMFLAICGAVDTDGNTIVHAALKSWHAGVYNYHHVTWSVESLTKHLIEINMERSDKTTEQEKIEAGQCHPLDRENKAGQNTVALLWDHYQQLTVGALWDDHYRYMQLNPTARDEQQLRYRDERFRTALGLLLDDPNISYRRALVPSLLKDPVRAKMLDRYLCCEELPNPVFAALIPVITPYIEGKHAALEWQEKLPHYTLKRLIAALQKYATAVGARTHKEKINFLCPLLQQALLEDTVPAHFLTVVYLALQGGNERTERPNPQGHLHALMREFAHTPVSQSGLTIGDGLASERYYFAEIIWMVVLGNKKKEQIARRAFMYFSDEQSSAQVDRDLIKAFNQENSPATYEHSFISVLTVFTRLRSDYQKKLPNFTFAILKNDLEKFRQQQRHRFGRLSRAQQTDLDIIALITAYDGPVELLSDFCSQLLRNESDKLPSAGLRLILEPYLPTPAVMQKLDATKPKPATPVAAPQGVAAESLAAKAIGTAAAAAPPAAASKGPGLFQPSADHSPLDAEDEGDYDFVEDQGAEDGKDADSAETTARPLESSVRSQVKTPPSSIFDTVGPKTQKAPDDSMRDYLAGDRCL